MSLDKIVDQMAKEAHELIVEIDAMSESLRAKKAELRVLDRLLAQAGFSLDKDKDTISNPRVRCPFCGKTYTHVNTARTHIMKIHNEIWSWGEVRDAQ
jgi:hypothetical protein